MPSNYASSYVLPTIGETTPTDPYLEKVRERIEVVRSKLMVLRSRLAEKTSQLLTSNPLHNRFIQKVLLVK